MENSYERFGLTSINLETNKVLVILFFDDGSSEAWAVKASASGRGPDTVALGQMLGDRLPMSIQVFSRTDYHVVGEEQPRYLKVSKLR
jgi:hypothetical protein